MVMIGIDPHKRTHIGQRRGRFDVGRVDESRRQ
jgi:hypothetical protein